MIKMITYAQISELSTEEHAELWDRMVAECPVIHLFARRPPREARAAITILRLGGRNKRVSRGSPGQFGVRRACGVLAEQLLAMADRKHRGFAAREQRLFDWLCKIAGHPTTMPAWCTGSDDGRLALVQSVIDGLGESFDETIGRIDRWDELQQKARENNKKRALEEEEQRRKQAEEVRQERNAVKRGRATLRELRKIVKHGLP